MRRLLSLLLLAILSLSSTSFSQTDNGCKFKFTGKARKLVKMRSPNKNYPKFKDGEPIDPVPATWRRNFDTEGKSKESLEAEIRVLKNRE